MGSGRDAVRRHHRARLVHDGDLRVQVFLVLDDDRADELGGLVGLALHGHPLEDVLELHASGLLGQDGNVVRIPLHKALALLDLAAFGHRDHGADHHRVTLQLAAVLGVDADESVLVQHDVVPLQGLHRA